ncbi:MAG: TatD family nuclease-associated radical SAM protein [Candidatus Thorarchaeota archaeon]
MSLAYFRDRTLYVNPTNRCTNDCVFCIRQFCDGVFGYDLRLTRDPTPAELVAAVTSSMKDRDLDEVAIVGLGEPTLNLDAILETIRAVKQLSSIHVRMDTNGHGLLIHPQRDVPGELAHAGLDSVNVSLNAPDAATYVRLCRPVYGESAFGSMLEFARRCRELMQVRLSVVNLPDLDLEACHRLAQDMDVDLRVRKFTGPDAVLQRIRLNV